MKCICLTKGYYWGKIIEKLVNNKEIIMAYTDDMKVEQLVSTSGGENGGFDTAFISAGMSPQEVYNNLISAASKHNVDVGSSFQAWVNAGGNLPEVRYLAQNAEVEAREKNEVVASSVSNVLKLVTNTVCKFDKLFENWNQVREKSIQLVGASESEREKLINERNQLYNDLLAKLDKCDLEKVFDFARSSNKYYTAKIAMDKNNGAPTDDIEDMQAANKGLGLLINLRKERSLTA